MDTAFQNDLPAFQTALLAFQIDVTPSVPLAPLRRWDEPPRGEVFAEVPRPAAWD